MDTQQIGGEHMNTTRFRSLLILVALLTLVAACAQKPTSTPPPPTPTNTPAVVATPAPESTPPATQVAATQPPAPPATLPTAPATPVPPVGAVAVVNGQAIMQQDYDAQVNQAMGYLKQQQGFDPNSQEGLAAVAQLRRQVMSWMVDQALIDAGFSSVLALEPPSGQEDWPLTLSEPGGRGVVLVRIGARQHALGASGIRKGDHIWNGREQGPVRSRRAAWVSAPRRILADIGRKAAVEGSAAAVADALSTAFMISAIEDIETLCLKHPGLEAWILERELLHFPAAGRPGTG